MKSTGFYFAFVCLFVAAQAAGPTLVLLDNLAIKETHSIFFKSLQGNFAILFLSITSMKICHHFYILFFVQFSNISITFLYVYICCLHFFCIFTLITCFFFRQGICSNIQTRRRCKSDNLKVRRISVQPSDHFCTNR